MIADSSQTVTMIPNGDFFFFSELVTRDESLLCAVIFGEILFAPVRTHRFLKALFLSHFLFNTIVLSSRNVHEISWLKVTSNPSFCTNIIAFCAQMCASPKSYAYRSR